VLALNFDGFSCPIASRPLMRKNNAIGEMHPTQALRFDSKVTSDMKFPLSSEQESQDICKCTLLASQKIRN
jgi:hypothetical protein